MRIIIAGSESRPRLEYSGLRANQVYRVAVSMNPKTWPVGCITICLRTLDKNCNVVNVLVVDNIYDNHPTSSFVGYMFEHLGEIDTMEVTLK